MDCVDFATTAVPAQEVLNLSTITNCGKHQSTGRDPIRPTPPPLLTDLYELTMCAAYFDRDMHAPATFSLFIREYPLDRGFFVSAGLETVLDFIENFRFSAQDMEYLKSLGLFSSEFLDYLGDFRFTGEVFAIPEGRLFFKDEPLLEITAPIIEAQIMESMVINTINFAVIIATKAARCFHAARGRGLTDFSLRRTHGPDASLHVARSSYIAGFSGTSNVLAGKNFGIPVYGTMAHSFIMSFTDEIEAFRAFARVFGNDTVLLIDTYDTLNGARKAITVAREMKARGESLRGVRLDSGDMSSLSKEVRKLLDDAGLEDVRIFASGSYDEFKIQECIRDGAPIDTFGVGTKMGVSADAPYSDMAYKLVEYDGRPVLKLSTGKQSIGGRKQVFRERSGGLFSGDIIARRDETHPGDVLMVRVMDKGRRIGETGSIDAMRRRFLEDFGSLDEAVKRIKDPDEYPVKISPALQDMQAQIKKEQKAIQIHGRQTDPHVP